jgi:hypothetical protein
MAILYYCHMVFMAHLQQLERCSSSAAAWSPSWQQCLCLVSMWHKAAMWCP